MIIFQMNTLFWQILFAGLMIGMMVHTLYWRREIELPWNKPGEEQTWRQFKQDHFGKVNTQKAVLWLVVLAVAAFAIFHWWGYGIITVGLASIALGLAIMDLVLVAWAPDEWAVKFVSGSVLKAALVFALVIPIGIALIGSVTWLWALLLIVAGAAIILTRVGGVEGLQEFLARQRRWNPAEEAEVDDEGTVDPDWVAAVLAEADAEEAALLAEVQALLREDEDDEELVLVEETPAPVVTVNINEADEAQLRTLTGVGPALAQKILEYRQTVHRFYSIAELGAAIGDAKANKVIADNPGRLSI